MRARVAAPEFLYDRELVFRMAEGEEKADSDRLGVNLRKRVEAKRLELPVGAHALDHADAAVERDERRRMLDTRPVEVSTRLPA